MKIGCFRAFRSWSGLFLQESAVGNSTPRTRTIIFFRVVRSWSGLFSQEEENGLANG